MKAPHFDLLGVDGKRHSPASARGQNGLLVMFICNHCPYVKRSLDRILSDSRELAKRGIGAIAVMPNDPGYNAEDSFDNMKRVAREKAFPFPYVIDESQEVARAYDAVCTPDFYAFDAGLELRYHGRLEDLVPAMTGAPPAKPTNSIGCSIKWKK
jgi:peroxiredoxin